MPTHKIKRLSDHDVREIVMFQEHCRDKDTMEPEAFYRKWQKYMGLSDAELEAIIAKLREGDYAD